MKKFRCWILKMNYGWVVFEKEFKDEKEALEYCNARDDFGSGAIVEEVSQ